MHKAWFQALSMHSLIGFMQYSYVVGPVMKPTLKVRKLRPGWVKELKPITGSSYPENFNVSWFCLRTGQTSVSLHIERLSSAPSPRDRLLMLPQPHPPCQAFCWVV